MFIYYTLQHQIIIHYLWMANSSLLFSIQISYLFTVVDVFCVVRSVRFIECYFRRKYPFFCCSFWIIRFVLYKRLRWAFCVKYGLGWCNSCGDFANGNSIRRRSFAEQRIQCSFGWDVHECTLCLSGPISPPEIELPHIAKQSALVHRWPFTAKRSLRQKISRRTQIHNSTPCESCSQ